MDSLEVGRKRGAAIVVALVAGLPGSASSQHSPTSEEQRRIVAERLRDHEGGGSGRELWTESSALGAVVVRYYLNDDQR
jgi:hypothetical protein